MTSPKTFISYCWTNAAHQQWVIDLATHLRESGVDVTLDKWDLHEGHDAFAFMEKMVSDVAVKKVVMVFDRSYAEKADKRAGGVGTETQIISAEVYNKVEQTKFVGVASELDADGKPFLPTYYKSRIYVDLSSDDIYASNFEQLLRWIFDKPLHVKPTLGKQPEFLSDQAVTLITGLRCRRAKELIQNGAATAEAALEDYLLTFASELEKFRIVKKPNEEFDDQVIKSIGDELPFRNEYIEALTLAVRYWRPGFSSKIKQFLEQIALYQFRPVAISSWRDHDFDNFRFIGNEIFLYTVAIFLRAELFAETGGLLAESYYVGEVATNRQEPMVEFTVFNDALPSLQHRNVRLKLSRLSLQADLIEQRSHGSGVSFENIMQADFILFLRSNLTNSTERRWWPQTLVYAGRMHHGPFEFFVRARSKRYFAGLMLTLGIQAKDEFDALIREFTEQKLQVPRWQFETINPAALTDWQNLNTR